MGEATPDIRRSGRAECLGTRQQLYLTSSPAWKRRDKCPWCDDCTTSPPPLDWWFPWACQSGRSTTPPRPARSWLRMEGRCER